MHCMRLRLFVLATILSLLGPANLWAQERFDLQKRGGHYYFATTINNTPVEVMLESGIPALLVGEKIYTELKMAEKLDFEPTQQKIRLFNHLHTIVYRSEGEIELGNSVYDGPIFILEGYEGVAVPIQFLKDRTTQRRVMMVNLKEGYLLVGATKDSLGGKRFKLSFDKEMGFPLVAAAIDITTPDGRAKLKGELIVDFGNPMLLFMMRQHQSLDKAVKKGLIELKEAYNKQGEVVAQGIFATSLMLFGQEYNDLSIGVTDKMTSIEQLGLLGTPFFSSPVVFDFDKGVMVVE